MSKKKTETPLKINTDFETALKTLVKDKSKEEGKNDKPKTKDKK